MLASVGVVRYLAGPAVHGMRLDKAVVHLTGLSRRKVRVAVNEGTVWLNGRACRVAGRTVQLGDILDLLPEVNPLRLPSPPPPPLPIIFEDGWVVAVNKPAGMLSQPAREKRAEELSAWEHLLLNLSYREGHRLQLYVVHRLDRPASGVLLFAKHQSAAASISQAFARDRVEKIYLAVVSGYPKLQGTINAPIAPDPLVPGRFLVSPSGKKAVTHFRVLVQGSELSILEVRPCSGRTHQIRVHLQSIGCPIVGDILYGSPHSAPRLLLHALQLSLPHPRGVFLRVHAPIPEDVRSFCHTHGLPLPEPTTKMPSSPHP